MGSAPCMCERMSVGTRDHALEPMYRPRRVVLLARAPACACVRTAVKVRPYAFGERIAPRHSAPKSERLASCSEGLMVPGVSEFWPSMEHTMGRVRRQSSSCNREQLRSALALPWHAWVRTAFPASSCGRGRRRCPPCACSTLDLASITLEPVSHASQLCTTPRNGSMRTTRVQPRQRTSERCSSTGMCTACPWRPMQVQMSSSTQSSAAARNLANALRLPAVLSAGLSAGPCEP